MCQQDNDTKQSPHWLPSARPQHADNAPTSGNNSTQSPKPIFARPGPGLCTNSAQHPRATVIDLPRCYRRGNNGGDLLSSFYPRQATPPAGGDFLYRTAERRLRQWRRIRNMARAALVVYFVALGYFLYWGLAL